MSIGPSPGAPATPESNAIEPSNPMVYVLLLSLSVLDVITRLFASVTVIQHVAVCPFGTDVATTSRLPSGPMRYDETLPIPTAPPTASVTTSAPSTILMPKGPGALEAVRATAPGVPYASGHTAIESSSSSETTRNRPSGVTSTSDGWEVGVASARSGPAIVRSPVVAS